MPRGGCAAGGLGVGGAVGRCPSHAVQGDHEEDGRRLSERSSTHVRYTAQQKVAAIAIYAEHGGREAGRRTGVHESTIRRWAAEAGVRHTPAQIAAATEANRERRQQLREQLRAEMLEKALDVLRRMDEEHIDFKGANVKQVTYPKAPAAACQHYATTLAILIDKFRLEIGEATSREEVVTVDKIDREIARLNEELARRGALD